MENYTITVLGCGVMGTAVISAILRSKVEPFPSKIICCTNTESLSIKLRSKLGDKVEYSFGPENNKAAVSEANVIILGCKPYMFLSIYEQVKDVCKDQLVISLLAGVTIEELQVMSPYVAKVMTNTPAQFGCGMAGIAFSPEAERKFSELVMQLICPIGKAIKLPEKNMDAATSLIGSGPAFCLLFLESLIDGAVRMGIPYDIAKESAVKVMEGTAKMVQETNEHPAVLKSKICTPGGTTIGGLLKMEDAGVRGGVARGVEEAAKISASFAKKK